LNKYLKCSVWRLAVRYDIYIYIYIYASLGGKGLREEDRLILLKRIPGAK
jgi:predicted RNA-binding protein with PUA domain